MVEKKWLSEFILKKELRHANDLVTNLRTLIRELEVRSRAL